MRINAIAIGIVLAVGGIITFAYGFLNDPFFIPFPDYDLMPESQRIQYQQRQKKMAVVKNWGLGLLILGGSSCTVGIILKQTRHGN